MKPTKQTVFIKEIHYYDWLIKSHNDDLIGHVKEQEGYFFTAEELNEYTANVIKKALETAAENAETKYVEPDGCATGDYYDVCKQSIKDTFDQTYKEFEV